jgi:hypothetical protein
MVNPSGSKLWRLGYRFGGKEKLMALGEYPVVNLAEARERHFAARKKVAADMDPMAERKAEAESRQRESGARQREAEKSVEHIARKCWEWRSVGKSPRHADCVLRCLRSDVFPAFGHKFIDNVNAADIPGTHAAVEDRGAKDIAKGVHETSGQIFHYAIAQGTARNPAADFSGPQPLRDFGSYPRLRAGQGARVQGSVFSRMNA